MHSLRTRFVIAGGVLLAATLATGLWSALTFARLSAAADETLRACGERIDWTAALAGSLEREDDALLLALSGAAAPAGRDLATERARGEQCYRGLVAALGDGADARGQAAQVREAIDAYRAAGSALVATGGPPAPLERYHCEVNPLLRRAVALCGAMREDNVRALRSAGVEGRDAAAHATGVVAAICVAALLLALAVPLWLARSVLPPVRRLTESLAAVGRGDFDRRLDPGPPDELGRLAADFNRMAQTLADYRRSSLGELLAAKATLEAALDALPDAVLVIAPDGTIAARNPPARAILAAKQAQGAAHLRDLPLRPEHRDAVEAALAGRPSVPARTDFGTALAAVLHGRVCRFQVAAVPIPHFTPGRHGAVIVLEDITDLARLDELRGELIGVASHELKTPLTALRMNLLLLHEQAATLAPAQCEMLDAARAGCEELGGTIDELLDVTRIEAGQLRLDLAVVDLPVIVDQVLRRLRPRFDDARVGVRVRDDGGPARVRADAARLGTVLTNLLTNALKYAPSGTTVTVHLASGQIAGPAGAAAVQVAVTDEGPGVPAEFRERIFEKFFRVEDQRGDHRNGVRGTGIGLYLCREIVRAHGGAVRCEPGDDGRGTRIAFTLPRAGA